MNKKLLWILVLSALLASFLGCPRPVIKPFDPMSYLGTKTPYKSGELALALNSLSACKPIHINFLGRHGSRHLAKGVNKEFLELVKKAEEEDQLKAKTLMSMLLKLSLLENPHAVGQLTAQGRQELRGIAHRMYKSFSELFSKEKAIVLQSTHVQRTKASLDAFLQGLNDLNDHIKNRAVIKTGIKGRCDANLRFFSGCDALEAHLEELKLKNKFTNAWNGALLTSSTKILNRIFAPDFLKRLDDKTRLFITRTIYHLCQLQADLDKNDAEPGFCSFFASADEIEPFNWEEDAIHYLEKSGGTKNALVHQVSCPLLYDFIKTSEAAIKDTNAPAANLRFAHAETLIPFLVQLGFYQDDILESILKDPRNSRFKGKEISPMAANVQWILYKCPQDYILRMRHNEEDKAFPIKGCSKEGCSFETIKNYYEQNHLTCDEKAWASTMCQGVSCGS